MAILYHSGIKTTHTGGAEMQSACQLFRSNLRQHLAQGDLKEEESGINRQPCG